MSFLLLCSFLQPFLFLTKLLLFITVIFFIFLLLKEIYNISNALFNVFHQDWHHTLMKGCFYVEENGMIVSLQYRVHIPQTTSVYLTIQPLNLSQNPGRHQSHILHCALFLSYLNASIRRFGLFVTVYTSEKLSPWMCVDTALYVVTGNEIKEDSNLVCFTELRDKEVSKAITFLLITSNLSF